MPDEPTIQSIPKAGSTTKRWPIMVTWGSVIVAIFCVGGWWETYQSLNKARNKIENLTVSENRNATAASVYYGFFRLREADAPKNLNESQLAYNELARRGAFKKELMLKRYSDIKPVILSRVSQGHLKPVGNEWNKDEKLQDLYKNAVLFGLIDKDPEIKKMTIPLLKAGIITPIATKGVNSGK